MKLEAIKKMWLRLRTGFGRFAPFNLAAIAVACLMVGENHNLLSDTVVFNLARGLYWGALAGVVCRLDGERRESAWRRIAAWPMTIHAAAQWDGTLPQKNVTCEVPVATAVWELRPGLAFAICDPNLTFSGTVGRTIDDVSVGGGIILSK